MRFHMAHFQETQLQMNVSQAAAALKRMVSVGLKCHGEVGYSAAVRVWLGKW
jgi:hypothetical protein